MTSQKRNVWEGSRKAELEYTRELRKLVRQFIEILKGYSDFDKLNSIDSVMRNYAELIEPWAFKTAQRMLLVVNQENKTIWRKSSEELSKSIRNTIESTNIGQVFQEKLQEQVTLIKSLPIEAAQKIHKMATEAFISGERSTTLISQIIAQNQEISYNRAKMIARTETSRVSSALTQARSESVGSTHYIWRTAKDPIVRESHRQMEGKVVSWDNPPTLDNLTGHAGALPNCRCYPSPIIPGFD